MSAGRKAALALLTLSGVVLVWYQPSGRLQLGTLSTKTPRSAFRYNKSVKTLLYWTTMFEREDFYLGVGEEPFAGCPVSACRSTANKDELDIEEFDALVFHGPDMKDEYAKAPQRRSKNQIYIYANLESPMNTASAFDRGEHNGFFNWTMTYRSDSDIFRPYGRFIKEKTNYTLPSVASVKKKQKKIAWQVSNCKTTSKREDLFGKLKDFIHVDVYGWCGQLACPRTDSDRCWKNIEENYKFYLSFENSFCEEYVTEKLFNALKYNVVPITYGAANYDVVAPPNSVIDVKKFETVDSLVKYIKELDNDPEKYLEYFKWKKDYVIVSDTQPVMCQICEKLHNVNVNSSSVYNDVEVWWNGPGFSKCKREKYLPKIVIRT